MKKLTIAVDVDDVLAAEAEFFIEFSNRTWGHTLSLDDYREHWAEVWQADHEEAEKRAALLHEPGIVSQYRLIEQAQVVLSALATDYKLMVVTSRRRVVRDETMVWLVDNFGAVFSDVHFTGFYDTGHHGGHLRTKAELLQNLGADFLIDDQPKHCFAAAEAGIKAVLFGDYAHSRGLSLPLGVTRCLDWAAVKAYFDDVAN